MKNEIEGRSKKEFNDAVIVPEFEDDFIAARKKCHGGGCNLPPTQRLKMRVILITCAKTFGVKHLNFLDKILHTINRWDMAIYSTDKLVGLLQQRSS